MLLNYTNAFGRSFLIQLIWEGISTLAAFPEKTVELDLTMIYLQDNKDPSGTNMGDEKEVTRKENNAAAAAEEHDGKLINIVFRR